MNFKKLTCSTALVVCFSAQLALADPIEDGKTAYERGDYITALKIFRSVADVVSDLGQPEKSEAQVYLGVMYERGRGVQQDFELAVRWYVEAAKARNPPAQYNIGLAYVSGKALPQDYVKAMFWFREASKNGLADAQAEIGNLYKYGLGVPKDEGEGWRWYSLAAAQGVASAQYQVGVAYDEGRRVPQNYTSAISWFKAAAEQGNGLAMGRLGLKYELGLDGERDLVAALTWYSLAEKMTPPEDIQVRNVLSIAKAGIMRQLIPEQISAAQRRTNDWLVIRGRK
jgi:uncharacterized protein